MKQTAKKMKAQGFGVLVLDPSGVPSEWDADFYTSDPHKFLDIVFKSQRCALFIDEGGEMIGRHGRELNMLATRSAQLGHRAFFIVQRANQIDTTIRANCESVIIFKQSLQDTKDLANEFVDPMINEAHKLEKLQYICKMGHEKCFIDTVNFS